MRPSQIFQLAHFTNNIEMPLLACLVMSSFPSDLISDNDVELAVEKELAFRWLKRVERSLRGFALQTLIFYFLKSENLEGERFYLY